MPKTRGTPGGGGSGRPRGSGWVTPRHKRPHAVSCNSRAGSDVAGAQILRRPKPDSAFRGRCQTLQRHCGLTRSTLGTARKQLGSRPWGRKPVGTKKGSRTPSGREPVNECAGRTVNATPCRTATGLQPCAAALPRVRVRVTEVHPGRGSSPQLLASAARLSPSPRGGGSPGPRGPDLGPRCRSGAPAAVTVPASARSSSSASWAGARRSTPGRR